MLRLLLILLLCASAVSAQNTRIWDYGVSGPSTLVLDEPIVSGAVATLTFVNGWTHNVNETFRLTYNEVEVDINFEWGRGDLPEKITAFPGAGYIAIPAEIVVEEDSTGYIHIYKWNGM